MKPTLSRLARAVLPLVVAGGLLLTACGGSVPGNAAVAVPGGNAAADDPLSGFDTAGLGGTGGGFDTTKTADLDMRVRVVNLWYPAQSKPGGAIDVWSGIPRYSKKLATVPYGGVSEFFAPVIPDPAGSGPTAKNSDYNIAFYPEGETDESDQLISQGEKSAPDQKLTIVVARPSADGAGATEQVLADDLGSDPAGGVFHELSTSTPPAGKAALLVNGLATQYLATGTDSSMPGFVLSSGGKCVDYLDPITGKLHDDPNIGNFVGGTQGITYFVDPGSPVQINQDQGRNDQTIDDTCALKSGIKIDPKLATGGRTYVFLHGADISSLQALVVPIG